MKFKVLKCFPLAISLSVTENLKVGQEVEIKDESVLVGLINAKYVEPVNKGKKNQYLDTDYVKTLEKSEKKFDIKETCQEIAEELEIDKKKMSKGKNKMMNGAKNKKAGK